MKECCRDEASLAESLVYERFVAQYLRLQGWDVKHIPRGDLSKPDRGDLLIKRGSESYIMDVKHPTDWVYRGERAPWFPFDKMYVCRKKNYKPNWVYCIVAHDFHALAMVWPCTVPADAWGEIKTKSDWYGEQITKWIPPKYAYPKRLHISGRAIR